MAATTQLSTSTNTNTNTNTTLPPTELKLGESRSKDFIATTTSVRHNFLVSVHKLNAEENKWDTDAYFTYSDAELKLVHVADSIEDMGVVLEKGEDDKDGESEKITKLVQKFRLSYQCILQLAGMSDEKIRDVIMLEADHECTKEEVDVWVHNYLNNKVVEEYSIITKLEKRLEIQRAKEDKSS